MLNILFISDIVCPYCLVAKEAMKQVLSETGIQAEITWQPFELTMEPKERVDTYHDEVRRSHYQVLVEPCRELGLDMKLPPNVVPRPYSRLAFEGWYYAREHGFGEAYNERIYKAYFVDELDIGQVDVLTGIASQLGMNADDFRAALENGTYTRQETNDALYARNVLQPKGVPTIYINDEKISLNDYSKEEMRQILTAAEADAMGQITSEEAGMTCGEDGCGPSAPAGMTCGEDGCGPSAPAGMTCGEDGCGQ